MSISQLLSLYFGICWIRSFSHSRSRKSWSCDV